MGLRSLRSLRAFGLLSLSLSLSFVSNEGLAFELTTTATGAEVRWDPPSFGYGAVFELGDPEGEPFAAACRAAADQWVLGSKLGLSATWEGPHASVAPADGRNTVAIASEWNDAFGAAARTVAHTELRYDVESGRMLEADIFLNGESFGFGAGEAAFDAESVVLHELGHALGIGHSCGDPGRTFPSCFSVPESERDRILEAVMAPTLAPGVERRSLAADDREAVSVHYGGAAVGATPGARALVRRCPEATLAIDPPSAALEVNLRYASGATSPLSDEWRDTEGGADLIVRDPESGWFSASYLVERPLLCAETPIEEDGGCGCRAHRQRDQNGAMLGLLFGLAIWRRRGGRSALRS